MQENIEKTYQKENEELRKKNQHLEKLLKEKSTYLDEALQKAKVAEKAKALFLANMSHEIRTPLNAIIGFSDILEKQDLNKEQRNYASIISTSASSLLDIIDDVLDISKIESGNFKIEKNPFVLSILCEHIVELYSVKAKEKNIKFIYDVDKNIPFKIDFDSIKLRQVLSNLLSNAIKFTQNNGSVYFKIEHIKNEDRKSKLKFSIEDTGIGIAQKDQENIFKPFMQVENGSARQFGGTGLGLTICENIVSLMNSKINLESKENEGSEFSFILEVDVLEKTNPLLKIQNNKKLAALHADEKNEEIRNTTLMYLKEYGQIQEFNKITDLKDIDMLFCFYEENLQNNLNEFKKINKNALIVYVGNKNLIKNKNYLHLINQNIELPIYGSKIFNVINDTNVIPCEIALSNEIRKKIDSNHKVLVAEDNENNKFLIKILLDKIGLDSFIVENGQEVINEYKNNKYDLVLMDINMPIKDGEEATKELIKAQKDEGLYKIPIIALTANSIEGDKEKYLASGMDDYISKPIEFNRLKQTIAKYLDIKEDDEEIRIDLESIAKDLNLSLSVATMLIKNFLKNIHKDIKKLKLAIENKDYEKTFEFIKQIKDSSSNLRLKHLVKILEEFNKKCEDKYIEDIDISKLKNTSNRLKKFLDI